MRFIAVTWGIVLAGTVLGVVAALAWLLGTPHGARWALEHVKEVAHLDLQVGKVEGRLLGPLELEDVRLRMPAMDLTLARARLEWTPMDLLARRVRLDALEAGTLAIALRPPATPAPQPAHPAIPRLPVDVEITNARLDRLSLQLAPDQPPQVIEGIEVDKLSWNGADLKIERLRAAYARTGALEASVVARLEPHAAQVAPLVLRTVGDAPMEIRAAGTIRLDEAPSALDVEWKALRWPLTGDPVVTSREGHLGVKGTPADVTAQGMLALGDTGTVTGTARYAAKAFEAKLAWKTLAWPFTGPARVTSAKGSVDASGTLQAYRFAIAGDLAADARQALPKNQPLLRTDAVAGQVKASGSGGLTSVALDRLEVAVARSKVQGSARVAWSPAITVDADIELVGVDPGLLVPEWPGSLNGHLKAVTTIVDRAPQSDFDIALGRSTLRGRSFDLDAQGRLEGKAVTVSTLQVWAGETKLQAHGRVTPPFDLDAQIDSPDLVAVWPGLGGRLSLHADVKGPVESPHVVAKGGVENLSYGGLTIAKASVDGDVTLQGAWRLGVDASDVTGPAKIDTVRIAVDGTAQSHDLKLDVGAPQATLALGLHGAFDRHALDWAGQVVSGRLVPHDLAEWNLEQPANLKLGRATLALDSACWRSDPARVCAEVTRDTTKMRTALRLEKLAFGYFASFLPRGWDLTGGVDGTGMVEIREGRLTDAKADLAIAPTEIKRDGQSLLRTQAGTVTVAAADGRIQGNAHLPLDNGHVDLVGNVGVAGDPAQRPLDAHLDVTLEDLAVLRVASPEIARASGRLEGVIAWTGTVAAPQATGSLDLTDGKVHLATPAIDIEELQARIHAADGGAIAVEASGKSGGGILRITGRAQFAGTDRGAQFEVNGDQFQAANMTEARAWISPDLHLKMVGKRIDVSGSVDVPRAEITPVSFDSGVGPSSDQRIVLGTEDAPLKAGTQFAADVTVNLGDKVHFEGFGLKSDLTGSVRVIEEPNRPGAGRGEVRLLNGHYKAYGQDLEIETGRLLFNGGPLTEPALDMRAQRKPNDDILVGVFVRGTLDKPLFQLYSTPTMPRERQLSWLVLGRDIDATPANGQEHNMMASAALSLGLTGTDFLAQNLRSGLHVDEISVGADAGEEADQARFTIGKYLSPKLYVSYGVGIFQRGQVFKLLYELGHGFKLSTESGVQTGGDLLYSVETGKKKAARTD